MMLANTKTLTNRSRSTLPHPLETRELVTPINTTEVKATNWNTTSELSIKETDDTNTEKSQVPTRRKKMRLRMLRRCSESSVRNSAQRKISSTGEGLDQV